jgi:TolB-like protein
MPKTRQLAAIMFTDIVGYTALMGSDEQHAFELLKQNRLLQKPIIGQYRGKWIKELGDGVLASFSAVSDAVTCACEIIKGCERIATLKLRIGIHLGEVIFENDDVFGDGVNIASRIQALAPVGGIWISQSVYQNITNKKNIKARFIRTENLKNVKDPVLIYEILTDNKNEYSGAAGEETSGKTSQKSLAILPFTDMSAARDQEYLGDGLAEELITLMAQIRELKVIGRTSSFSFKKKDVDLRTIGKILGADAILEGSVQKAGNRIRITAQLINASDGYHMWSRRYDREMDDIFSLQDDISSMIAEQLKLNLLVEPATTIEKRPTENLQAYDLYLKGHYNYKKFTLEGYQLAIEYFEKALVLDPLYADAWWSLGVANFEMHGWNYFSRESMERARYCAEKAIAIDESNGYAHFLLALIHFDCDWDWEKTESEVAIGKKYDLSAYYFFLPIESWYRAFIFGDFDFAVRELQKGIEKDPLSIFYLLHLALIHLHALRDYPKTREFLNRILELDPRYTDAFGPMCISYLYEGQFAHAKEYAGRLYDASGEKALAASNLIICLAALDRKEEARNLYATVKESLPVNQFPAHFHAQVNAWLGDIDEAFHYLELTFEERNYWTYTLKYSPDWDLLRPDPRFEKMVERMHFPDPGLSANSKKKSQ